MTNRFVIKRREFFSVFFLILLSFFLTQCASLPRMNDSAASGKGPPEIVSARGHLSKRQSKAIMERLEREAGPTDILKRYLLIMQNVSDEPLVAGNDVTLLVDGPATYDAMFKAIETATDHIHLETYIFEDDEVGRRFADMLLKKQAEGVHVSVMYDAYGSFHTPAAFFKRLSDGGIQVVQFNPLGPSAGDRVWRVTNRDHRKILIIDGRVAFVGGVNISNVYTSGSSPSKGERDAKSDSKRVTQQNWRDTHIKIEGAVVARLQKLFLENWHSQNGPPLADKSDFPPLQQEGTDLVQVIGNTPGEDNRLTYLMYLSAVTFAKKYVYVTSSYFVPDGRIIKALKAAAGRGVDVRIILPSVSDENRIFYAGRSYYDDLLEAGVKLYERRGGLLHAKTAVIDGVWSTVGSTNLDLWSFLRNDEVNAIILSANFADEMNALFQKDLEASEAITMAKWKQRPLSERLNEWFSRLVHHWL